MMTKEQAISAAEKFLLAVYGNEYEACASIVTASAEKNCWYLSKSLDEVIKLCESIKEGLKG